MTNTGITICVMLGCKECKGEPDEGMVNLLEFSLAHTIHGVISGVNSMRVEFWGAFRFFAVAWVLPCHEMDSSCGSRGLSKETPETYPRLSLLACTLMYPCLWLALPCGRA